MRQYQEIVENLNCVARNKPKAELVQVIKEENKQIRSLQQENKELRDTLQELQIGAETIMNKYRMHVTTLVNTTGVNYNCHQRLQR